MSLQDAREIKKLLNSKNGFESQFRIRARDAIARTLVELASENNLMISLDEAYVCASNWDGLHPGDWLSDDEISGIVLGKGGAHNADGPTGPCRPSTPGSEDLTPSVPPCNPSIPGEDEFEDERGPSVPCTPSTPGAFEDERGPSVPCTPSTPGE